MRRGKTGGEPSTAQQMCSCRVVYAGRNFTPRSKLSITRNGETLSLRVDEILEKKFDDVFQLDGKRYSYPLDKILREKDEISSQYVANGIISRYISLLGRIGGNDRGISRIESSSPSSRSSFAARQPYPTSSIFRLREKKRKKGEREKKKTKLWKPNKRILPELVPAFFSSDRTN